MIKTAAIDNVTPALARAWHPVALGSEVAEHPVGVELLGRRWALARLDGRLVAFEDRCPHRLAPLSAGTILGATLQCRYHGWEFEPGGRCVNIPAVGADAPIPSRACARTPAGVQERYGLIWLAPDEPVCGLFDFPEWDDPAYDRGLCEVRRTPVSVPQLVDNFLDASHFPTVHRNSFGTPEAALVSPHTVTRDGWEVSTTYEAPYRNYDDPLVATGEHPLVQPHVLFKAGRPGGTALIRLYFPVTGATLAILFALQPERYGSSRMYKLVARNDFAGDRARMDECVKYEDQILDEDLDLLERYERFELAADLRVELHTKADKLSVAYRQLLAELVGS
jgi:phenylpropionate dioxygenase-like ring-hydroxylating dioxygenase large terminal subunit